MKMTIKLINRSQGELHLSDQHRLIAGSSFTFGHDLDIVLLATLDKILTRHRIDPSSLESFKIKSDSQSGELGQVIASSLARAVTTKEA